MGIWSGGLMWPATNINAVRNYSLVFKMIIGSVGTGLFRRCSEGFKPRCGGELVSCILWRAVFLKKLCVSYRRAAFCHLEEPIPLRLTRELNMAATVRWVALQWLWAIVPVGGGWPSGDVSIAQSVPCVHKWKLCATKSSAVTPVFVGGGYPAMAQIIND
jgi:hypothetical protein